MSTAIDRSTGSAGRLGQIRRFRMMTVAAAVVAALIGWAVVGPLLGVRLAVRFGPGSPTVQVAVGSVVIVSVLVGLAGWGLLAALERLTAKARTIWTIVAVVVLAVSLFGPTGGVTPATVVALMCLHLLVGAVLIIGLWRSASRS